MRGVSLLLDNSNKISYKSAKGFWWDGELSDIYFEDNYLGDLEDLNKTFTLVLAFAAALENEGLYNDIFQSQRGHCPS